MIEPVTGKINPVTVLNFYIMSKCDFQIPFSGSKESIVEKARTEVERYGKFSGDTSRGIFEIKVLGTITGSYTIESGYMHILIDAKPVFLSCNKIEQFMMQHFG
ncbi:MAG TPA: hypothetical protein VM012_09740 [Flavitalea sp.]|nr:hypothetical protein [Flavitalea sp.]